MSDCRQESPARDTESYTKTPHTPAWPAPRRNWECCVCFVSVESHPWVENGNRSASTCYDQSKNIRICLKFFLGSLLIGLEGRYKCRSQSYPRDLFLTNIYLTFYNCPALCDLWPLPSSCGCLNGFQLHNNHTTSNIAVLYRLYIQKLTNTRKSILLTSPAASSTGEFCQHY